MTDDKLDTRLEQVALGHEAEQALNVVGPILDQQEEAAIKAGVTLVRAGEMSTEVALAGWCQLAALRQTRSDLESRVRAGESASRNVKQIMDARADTKERRLNVHT